MPIENNIFEKLFNNKSKKIEFALADDIENYKKQMLKLSDSALSKMLSAEKEIADYGKLASDVKGYATLILQDIAQLETKAKEIGIDIPSNILQTKKMANDYYLKAGSIQKFASSFNIETPGKF
jgi:hypothetical protein